MDPVLLVERFLETYFPAAEIAVVAGSTAAGNRTATSDIDLLVIGPAEMFEADRDALATFIEFGGEGFEVFAYSPDAFDRWARHDLADYRPVLLDMLANGIAVRSSPDLPDLRTRWTDALNRGPVIDEHQLALRRYVLTDVLDDLADATDALERRTLADEAFRHLAELLLLQHRRWLGSGKWLARRLRQWDAERCNALAAPLLADDVPRFLEIAQGELSSLGGRVQAGFVR
ncbi:nucleotidyltransferase domain-containing protein [Glaciibacter flavus]|uniref:nucleotidyltransferase domain-containing protein n=1 Tax=Orlajensenia flava TaxID=2565934 RepID=UPI003AFFCEC5